MAGDVVIRAKGLGKKYAIGHQVLDGTQTLRETIARSAARFGRTTRDMLSGKPLIAGDEIEEFWALKDVNFEVKRGEVVGIIGRNGAGKSTLLKVLSRITEPSEGSVEIRGRVASLLEVGTGFHPELTGRENIFLNGAILGMGRAEIHRKFDEIVAFAEIEKFLDTPVKRYSSGMYVRLAFAVAAHLEPEILIVDEVLAVGDVEFQKKCLGKMQDVAGEGRTVLFVSHNMAAARALCDRGLVLEHGRRVLTGSMLEAIDYYSAINSKNVSQKLFEDIELLDLTVESRDVGTEGHLVFQVQMNIKASNIIKHLSLVIHGDCGTRLSVVDLRESLNLPRRFEKGQIAISGEVSGLRLVEKEYEVSLYIGNDHQTADFHSLHSFRPAPPSDLSRRYAPENLGYFDVRPRNVRTSR
jgi:ABC-type polysaccharide/polyol phosphate transport system ATPase subunit